MEINNNLERGSDSSCIDTSCDDHYARSHMTGGDRFNNDNISNRYENDNHGDNDINRNNLYVDDMSCKNVHKDAIDNHNKDVHTIDNPNEYIIGKGNNGGNSTDINGSSKNCNGNAKERQWKDNNSSDIIRQLNSNDDDNDDIDIENISDHNDNDINHNYNDTNKGIGNIDDSDKNHPNIDLNNKVIDENEANPDQVLNKKFRYLCNNSSSFIGMISMMKLEYDYKKSTEHAYTYVRKYENTLINDNQNTDIHKNDANKDLEFVGKYAKERSELDYSYHSQYTHTRQYFHDDLIDRFFETTVEDCCTHMISDRPKENWLVFTAGCMGAGKGHTLTWLHSQGIFPLDAFVRVDPDALRELLPETEEYIRRDEDTAGYLTQKEVGHVCEVLTISALIQGKNVLVDGSLRDAEWYHEYITDLKARFPKLKIAILYITASRRTILKRAKSRAVATGRVVPEEVILKTMTDLPKSIRILSPLVDFVVTFENEERRGGEPKLLHSIRRNSSNTSLDASGDICVPHPSLDPADRRPSYSSFSRFPSKRFIPVQTASFSTLSTSSSDDEEDSDDGGFFLHNNNIKNYNNNTEINVHDNYDIKHSENHTDNNNEKDNNINNNNANNNDNDSNNNTVSLNNNDDYKYNNNRAFHEYDETDIIENMFVDKLLEKRTLPNPDPNPNPIIENMSNPILENMCVDKILEKKRSLKDIVQDKMMKKSKEVSKEVNRMIRDCSRKMQDVGYETDDSDEEQKKIICEGNLKIKVLGAMGVKFNLPSPPTPSQVGGDMKQFETINNSVEKSDENSKNKDLPLKPDLTTNKQDGSHDDDDWKAEFKAVW
eukprot:CAMPEP_0119042274 /NCGR_PEP_ID=MMETSP1177-20130426/14509_1 /TAXON_ID=2985 /ORGANISM="Ochromonas sp, Strain CCMP1899" /LENGTH=829 /DNA_ID=CAMNT_0007008945 /DNA_START=391 /DNA_END=2877 /DNA_ORIENTATION=-